MRKATPRGKSLDLAMLVMDLQSLWSVEEAAHAFMKQESRLDMLINNAGVSVPSAILKILGNFMQGSASYLS